MPKFIVPSDMYPGALNSKGQLVRVGGEIDIPDGEYLSLRLIPVDQEGLEQLQRAQDARNKYYADIGAARKLAGEKHVAPRPVVLKEIGSAVEVGKPLPKGKALDELMMSDARSGSPAQKAEEKSEPAPKREFFKKSKAPAKD